MIKTKDSFSEVVGFASFIDDSFRPCLLFSDRTKWATKTILKILRDSFSQVASLEVDKGGSFSLFFSLVSKRHLPFQSSRSFSRDSFERALSLGRLSIELSHATPEERLLY